MESFGLDEDDINPHLSPRTGALREKKTKRLLYVHEPSLMVLKGMTAPAGKRRTDLHLLHRFN